MTDAQRSGCGLIGAGVIVASACACNIWTGAFGLGLIAFAIWKPST